jgi:hypothetical protein
MVNTAFVVNRPQDRGRAELVQKPQCSHSAVWITLVRDAGRATVALMLRRKKLLPWARLAFIEASPFAVACPTTDLGSGLPADATSKSRGDRGVN